MHSFVMSNNDKFFVATQCQLPETKPRCYRPYGFKLSIALLGMLSLAWFLNKTLDQSLFPIYYVKIIGTPKHAVEPMVKKAIQEAKTNRTGSINLATLETRLKQASWVEQLSLKHWLPWTLVIRLKMRDPVALWEQDESKTGLAKQCIDHKGVVFELVSSLKAANIPTLIGASQQIKDLLAYYRGLETLLQSQSLKVASVQLDPDQRCSVRLVNGMQLVFGHFNPYRQLQKLLDVHPSVLHQARNIAVLDLRYQRGMAITFRSSAV